MGSHTGQPPSPEQIVDRIDRAQVRLLDPIRSLGPAELDAPCGLPGWRRRHVLAHLAVNAAGVERVLVAARDERLADKYPGGGAERDRLIGAAAELPPAPLVDLLARSGTRLLEVMRALPADAWFRPIRQRGELIPAWRSAWLRWLELDVHHVDLRLDRGPQDLDPGLTGDALAWSARRLPDRLPRATGLRLEAPGLPSIAVSAAHGHPRTTYVVEGRGEAILWWLLRPTEVDPSSLSVRDELGGRVALPRLGPWG